MQFSKAFVVVVALFFSCTDCAKFAASAVAQAPTILAMTNNATVVQLREGSELIVTLRGNPTTGFTWTRIDPTPSPILITVLQPTGSEFVYTPEPSGLMGAPGNFTFLFEAVQVGCAHLKLGYKRGWESKSPAIIFVAEVIVI
jgi:inhibitor of cysteine peptidase